MTTIEPLHPDRADAAAPARTDPPAPAALDARLARLFRHTLRTRQVNPLLFMVMHFRATEGARDADGE